MMGSGVRVPPSALWVCRAFVDRLRRAPCSEVPEGYISALIVLVEKCGPDQALVPLCARGITCAKRGEPMFLRPVEAAELAGLSTRAIYRAIARSDLPASRLCS